MRPSVIAANWKMNTTVSEAIQLVRQMLMDLDDFNNVVKILCPPFISIYSVWQITRHTSIKLGAQNMFFEGKGAFTGEISAGMLSGLCEYVILGHSERRQIFNESDGTVHRKIAKAMEEGITPILCVGESIEDNEKGNTLKVVGLQIESALEGIVPAELIIAYEPIWAIGSGRAASGKQANETASQIRSKLGDVWGKKLAMQTCILYGGSVNSSNIDEFVSQPDIDGALVGGASLNPEEFLRIVKQTSDISAPA